MNLFIASQRKEKYVTIFILWRKFYTKISAIMQRADPPPLASIVESSGDTIFA
jgi:hypothetical protein